MTKEEMLIMIDKTNEDLEKSINFHMRMIGPTILKLMVKKSPSEEEVKEVSLSYAKDILEKIVYLTRNIPKMKEEIEKDNIQFDLQGFEDQFYANQNTVNKMTDEKIQKRINKVIDKADKKIKEIEDKSI